MVYVSAGRVEEVTNSGQKFRPIGESFNKKMAHYIFPGLKGPLCRILGESIS